MLHKQEPYKRRVKTGDVFALKFDEHFIFGQVAAQNIPFGGLAKSQHKVFVFNYRSPDRSSWSRALEASLLVPPEFINNLGFSRGFMPVVGSAPIVNIDASSICYKTFRKQQYVDESGAPCEIRPIVGFYGFGNWLTLSDKIESALGGRA